VKKVAPNFVRFSLFGVMPIF